MTIALAMAKIDMNYRDIFAGEERYMPRIISGKARGLKLETMEGQETRPTADRTKESFFNIISGRIPGCLFADIFSGSGSIGCEALSRGAGIVTFVESALECVKIINKNVGKLKFENKHFIFGEDYKQGLKKMDKQDIIYLDPPFNKGIGAECLEYIAKYDILRFNGIIVLEHDFKENIPGSVGGLIKYDARKYGKCALSFYKYEV